MYTRPQYAAYKYQLFFYDLSLRLSYKEIHMTVHKRLEERRSKIAGSNIFWRSFSSRVGKFVWTMSRNTFAICAPEPLIRAKPPVYVPSSNQN